MAIPATVRTVVAMFGIGVRPICCHSISPEWAFAARIRSLVIKRLNELLRVAAGVRRRGSASGHKRGSFNDMVPLGTSEPSTVKISPSLRRGASIP